MMEWQTDSELEKSKLEKYNEYIKAGYTWSVDAVNNEEQTVTLCKLNNPEECKTVRATEFKRFPIIGEIVKKIKYIFGRGGKRTQKRRRTNKKRKN